MKQVEGRRAYDVHPEKPWEGVLFALLDECPPDRPVHFWGWMPIHPIYAGQMYRWEVRWYAKEAHA